MSGAAYDTLLTLLRSRRSVRRFLPDAVPADAVDQLVEAARWAPSAGNRQAWRFIAVANRDLLGRMAAAVQDEVDQIRGILRADLKASVGSYLDNFTHFGHAPLVLVAIYRAGADLLAGAAPDSGGRGAAQSEHDALASVSAAVQNALLAAHALGLGACWMTGPLVCGERLQKLLSVPEGWSIAALIPVGRPAEDPPAPARRAVARLLQRID